MAVYIEFKGEQVELIDRDQILYMHDKSLKQDEWLINTFYPKKQGFANTSKVNFAELETNDLLAPFVTPDAKARNIGGGGTFESQEVHAAYLKPELSIRPTDVQDQFVVNMLRNFNLIADDAVINGTLSNAEKLRICQMINVMKNRQAIDNRKRLMAIDVLTKGYTEYESEDFAYYKADYRRSADMNVRVTTDWNVDSADVSGDFDVALDRMFDIAGVQPEILLSTSNVYNVATRSDSFKDRFTKADGSNVVNNTLLPSFARSANATLKGNIDGVEWWVYDAKHSLNGAKEHYIDPTTLYFIADTEGTQCQCQIMHLDVLGAPLEYYDYVDYSKNPSVLAQIAESSPLLAPSMSNGVLALKVMA